MMKRSKALKLFLLAMCACCLSAVVTSCKANASESGSESESSNSASENVADSESPVIVVTGVKLEEANAIEVGSKLVLPTITVTDNKDAGIQAEVALYYNGGPVQAINGEYWFSGLGTYTLKINATDSAGNKAEEVSVTYYAQDSKAPVIDDIGTQMGVVGERWTVVYPYVDDYHNTATEVYVKAPSASEFVKVTDSSILLEEQGNYQVKYVATEKTENGLSSELIITLLSTEDGYVNDFELESEYNKITVEQGLLTGMTAELSNEFSTSGESSLKVVMNKAPEGSVDSWPCVRIPFISKNITGYSYVSMDIYNSGDVELTINACLYSMENGVFGRGEDGKAVTIAPNEKKTCVWAIDSIIGGMSKTNVTGVYLFCNVFTDADREFHLDAVKLGKEEEPTTSVLFNETFDFETDSVSRLVTLNEKSYSTAYDHTGNNGGSVKVVGEKQVEIHVRANEMIEKQDWSAYSYIELWVYNAGETDAETWPLWLVDTQNKNYRGGSFLLKAKEWTRVYIDIQAAKDAIDIRNISLFFIEFKGSYELYYDDIKVYYDEEKVETDLLFKERFDDASNVSKVDTVTKEFSVDKDHTNNLGGSVKVTLASDVCMSVAFFANADSMIPVSDWSAYSTVELWAYAATENYCFDLWIIDQNDKNYRENATTLVAGEWTKLTISLDNAAAAGVVDLTKVKQILIEFREAGVVYLDDLKVYGKAQEPEAPVEPDEPDEPETPVQTDDYLFQENFDTDANIMVDIPTKEYAADFGHDANGSVKFQIADTGLGWNTPLYLHTRTNEFFTSVGGDWSEYEYFECWVYNANDTDSTVYPLHLNDGTMDWRGDSYTAPAKSWLKLYIDLTKAKEVGLDLTKISNFQVEFQVLGTYYLDDVKIGRAHRETEEPEDTTDTTEYLFRENFDTDANIMVDIPTKEYAADFGHDANGSVKFQIADTGLGWNTPLYLHTRTNEFFTSVGGDWSEYEYFECWVYNANDTDSTVYPLHLNDGTMDWRGDSYTAPAKSWLKLYIDLTKAKEAGLDLTKISNFQVEFQVLGTYYLDDVKIGRAPKETVQYKPLGELTLTNAEAVYGETDMQLKTLGGDAYAISDVTVTDFTYTAKVSNLGTEGAVSLLFRVQDTDHFYCVNFSATEMKFWIKNGGEVAFRTYAPEGGFEANKEYTVKVEAVGYEIKIYLDGAEVISYTDSEQYFASGKLGFNVWATSAKYSEVSYSEVKAEEGEETV